MARPASRADVNPDALASLDEALAVYSRDAMESVSMFRESIAHRLRKIENMEQSARDALERARAECDDAGDDDDMEALDSEREDASTRLAEIQHWMNAVTARYAEFQTRESVYRQTLQGSIFGARKFLQGKAEQIRYAQALTLSPPGAAVATNRGTASTGSAQPTDALSPLPRGFRWVALSEIDLSTQLAGLNPSTKTTRDDMRTGMLRLLDTVLPALDADPSRRSDYFRQLDEDQGVEYSSGVQQVYDAFFGSTNYIYLVRGVDGRLEIINGRHRIEMAREMGWLTVPARVRD